MGLLGEQALLERVLAHVVEKTTDLSDALWREPVENYLSPERLELEIARVFRRSAIVFCPSVQLAETGAYLARDAVGIPIVAVRGADGVVRAFRNACRHRGTQLVEGAGCKKVLTCPYHAWTYGLDGRLRGVPDEHGFPGLDKETHGLVPVHTVERYGFVFVTLEGEADPGPELDQMGELMTGDGWEVISHTQREVPANWKLIAEGFLEGYHIRHTHPETFYPRQYDNLNVIEHFGRNNRITYPYRIVEKLRATPLDQWVSRQAVTNVYHLFPNVMISTHPTTVAMSIFEPLATDRTRVISYVMSNAMDSEEGRKFTAKSRELILAAKAEDRAMVTAAQRGIKSGANEVLIFGLFEGALRHLHQSLAAAIQAD